MGGLLSSTLRTTPGNILALVGLGSECLASISHWPHGISGFISVWVALT